MITEQITISMHDRVFADAMKLNANDLCCYLFDSPNAEGCNGIWAICNRIESLDLEISEIDSEARRCIRCMMSGMLPPGISAHNDTTALWMRGRWESETGISSSPRQA
jgi:hypothetical protein